MQYTSSHWIEVLGLWWWKTGSLLDTVFYENRLPVSKHRFFSWCAKQTQWERHFEMMTAECAMRPPNAYLLKRVSIRTATGEAFLMWRPLGEPLQPVRRRETAGQAQATAMSQQELLCSDLIGGRRSSWRRSGCSCISKVNRAYWYTEFVFNQWNN